MAKCFTCDSQLIWQNDYDTEDVDEYSIVSMYDCKKCDTWYEVYHDKRSKKYKKEKKK
jgi:hypothetical protein